MDDFFSNIPLRESELCRECKYSVVSNNNGNLLCLHEKSYHFGTAIPLETDQRGFCYFERETAGETFEQENEKGDSNAIHNHQATAGISSNIL